MEYEVPYNFDEGLIKFYKKNSHFIRYIYLPPYKDDCSNTRTIIETNVKGKCYMPQSREEYERNLNIIKQAKLQFVVLWQLKDKIITDDIIHYYYRLGASGFIVASDVNARIIKEYNPNLFVICSIVQKVTDNILQRDFDNYDYIILYYTFNRALNALKLLTNLRHKIILMPNAICNVDCPSTHHWFPQNNKPFEPSKDCPVSCYNIENSAVILPEHLYLFDKLINGYKLQGREYTTEAIKYLCHFYFNRTQYDDFIDPFMSDEMAIRFKNIIKSTPLQTYYNLKSPSIINKILRYSV